MALSAPVVVTEENEFFWFMGRAWNRIVNLYDFLVFSSLLLSFECVAMAFVSCFIQEVPWNAMIAVIPFFAAFSIYNLNRKTDEDEDAINRQDRFAFTKRYERGLYYGAILSLVICLVISASCGIMALLATSAPFLLGMLYSFRWLPKPLGYRRLKEIPAVKNIIVGLAWGIPLSLLPVFVNKGTPGARTAIMFLLFFMWGFMASLIPDIRDRTGDARAGVRTIPVIYGQEQTKLLLRGVLLVLGVPAVVYSLLFLPPFTTLLIVAANVYSHGCVYLLDRAHTIDFVADALSDGQYIFLASAILIIASVFPRF